MNIEIYETVIQASGAELESYITDLFPEGFGHDFHPLRTWDDAWKFVEYFEGTAIWFEGQRFQIYLSILLDQKVSTTFQLLSLDKATMCKAAILTKLDPLAFHADLQAVVEEYGQASGVFVALGKGTIENENSPMYRRITDKLVQLKFEDFQWRMDNDIPL